MKKLIVFVILLTFGQTAFAQNPSYQQKLYYSCKVWGFVKYFHSKVSVCEINWDSVLVGNLPLIKNAVSSNDFNNVLYQMLQAAGPMAIATTALPDTIPAELKRNRNFGWINNAVFRNDVRVILDTIKNNFRPHPVCWVNYYGYGSWLKFQYDNPILNSDLSTSYPDEFTRLMGIFRYWNIINYFNPYNYILDTPWDSTLYNSVLSIANASNYTDFFMTFKKMTSNLDDAHTEGLTSRFLSAYVPKILLRYSQGNYIVVKSGYTQINKGDIIVSVNGKTTTQWEDSLRPYISAGNPSVFRRFMCRNLLRGASGSAIQIEYKDSLGNTNNITLYRYSIYYHNWFYEYYPNDTLASVKWKKWDCNVGYVHMGNLSTSDVNTMYNELKNTKAIIFDIRNYPNGTGWDIADLLYPNNTCYAKFTVPDVTYPGTFSWVFSDIGINGNSSYYTGKVVILCNQETQSHAEFTCMMLKAMPNTVIVGSQTAGADGNITGFKFSQNIRTGFTSLGAFYPDGTETQRIGIVPDSFVYITPEGIRHGRDEVLEKALEIAGCVTSIEDNEAAKSELSVYPNPTSGKITIDLGKTYKAVNVKVRNTFGQVVLTKSFEITNKLNFEIEGAKGVYFVEIWTSEGNVAQMKVVKQ